MPVNHHERGYEDVIAELQAGLPEAQRYLSILEVLDGEPMRRSDLQPLLADVGEERLDACLCGLQREALVDRTTNARTEPVVHWYELSALGQEVLALLREERGRHSLDET